MALSSTDDLKLAINQILIYMDNVFGGIDWERLPIYTKMLPVDAATLRGLYATYKKAQSNRPTTIELHPNSHGANVTTALMG